MKKYNITISAVCPPEKRWEWEQEISNDYTVTELGRTIRLEGREKTEEDFFKLQHLIQNFPDHHVHVEEAKSDGQKKRQTPSCVPSQELE